MTLDDRGGAVTGCACNLCAGQRKPFPVVPSIDYYTVMDKSNTQHYGGFDLAFATSVRRRCNGVLRRHSLVPARQGVIIP